MERDWSSVDRALLARCRFPAFTTPDEAVCAVSGGADSSALAVLALAAGLRPTLVHVDHGSRPGSAAEADVVARLADLLGCPFRSERLAVAAGPNFEARARRARYEVLPVGVMTGHTLDDQAETVLLNLLRGAGADGLSGMDPAGERVRRPLLAVRRHETVGLCAALGIDTVIDPMNSDARYRRNRVRHELLPLLDSIAERDIAPILARQADLLRDEAAVLQDVSASVDPTDAAAVARTHPAVAKRVLRAWLRAAGTTDHPPDLATVERALSVARGDAVACDLGGGYRLERHRQRLSIVHPVPDAQSPA